MKKKNYKLYIVMAVFFILIILSAGCTVDSFGIEKGKESYTRISEEAKIPDLVDEKRIVNWVLDDMEIREFSIFDNLSYVEKVIINNSFAGLFRIVDSELQMDLVQTVSVSETGREYTFELRDSRWSNGEKISAYDVVNSWEKYDAKSSKSLFEKIGIESVRALDQKLINIKLSRNNEKLLYYLSDLSYRVYPDEILEGKKMAGDNNIIFSGKYSYVITDEIEELKLIKNERHYDARNHYINEIHIVPALLYSNNKEDRFEFYIDSSQSIKDYKELINSSDDFNYVATGLIKSILINPELEKLSNKYDRIKLLDSLDIKGVSDYSSKGLSTVVDTFAKIDSWEFSYGYTEDRKIAKQNDTFEFDDLSITYIDNKENQMIYEILSLMLSTNYNINLIADPVDKLECSKKIINGDYELMLKEIDGFGHLNDAYLLNMKSELTDVYNKCFDDDFYDSIKKYHHTSDIQYLKKAELCLKLDAYVSPMYNCGFPILGDERLDLKDFYHSYYLDFSKIAYN